MGAAAHDDSAEVKNVAIPVPLAPQPAETPVAPVPSCGSVACQCRPQDMTIKDVLTEIRERLMSIISDINDELAAL
jgi:hypothetical protein